LNIKLTIPDNVQSIGESAFSNCENLTGALYIPENCKIIGKNAFEGCNGLHSIIYKNRVYMNSDKGKAMLNEEVGNVVW
jgi:hypothetical protein